MTLIGLLGRGFGAVSPPDAPTLTWADNGDGTGAVATIAGAAAGSTNKIYTVPRTGGSWTLAGTRTGNGTIELDLAVGAYLAYLLSEKDGACAISDVAVISVTDVDLGGRVKQICQAVADLLATADVAGVFTESLGAARAYMTAAEVEDLSSIDVLVVPSHSSRKRTSNGTYRRDVVVEILVRKRFTEDVGDDLTNADATVSLIEEIDDYLADPENHDLTLPDGVLAVYVEPGDKRADSEITNGLGAYWHWEHVTTLRQVTGTVRVAYHTDEDY